MAEQKTRRPLHKNPWLWGVVALIALDALFRFTPLLKRIPEPPPVVATLPDFSLVRADGTPFGRADLAGAVHLAAFVEDPERAGAVVGPMLRLEAYVLEQAPYERYGDELRLMLIQPGSPETLSALAAARGLTDPRWTLVGGDAAPVIRALASAAAAAEVAGEALVLIIDGEGGVRGFFDAAEEEGREEAFWRAMRTLEAAHEDR